MRKTLATVTAVIVLASVLAGPAAADRRDRVRYEKYRQDPVLKQIIEEMDSLKAAADSITREIDESYREMEKKEKKDRKIIRFDFSGIDKPESPEAFDAPFHFPPLPQHLTGMCWCFSTTSFLESEIKRLHGREVKISELYTIYWEYVEKARGYIRKRGHQPFAQGGEADGVLLIWEQYGAVPAEAYTGLPGGTTKHNHTPLLEDMKTFLELCAERGYWEEEPILAQIRLMLDERLGTPPESFEYDGKTMSPAEFYEQVIDIDTSDYIQVMSTLAVPFKTMDSFDVPDNWRPTYTYYNVGLEDFYHYIKKAAQTGYTVCIGGDVSEPGYYGEEDAAVIPSFDIPWEYIDQDSRELRIFNKTTEDDHGVHLLAWKRVKGKDWYLIKDSARASRRGRFHGYLFYREDYIKLKMLTFMVHRDVLEDIWPDIEKARSDMENRVKE
jgi:bleomycin hydrolase